MSGAPPLRGQAAAEAGRRERGVRAMAAYAPPSAGAPAAPDAPALPPAAAAQAAAAARAAAVAVAQPAVVAQPLAPALAPPQYAGLATRALALALDAAIVNGVALVVGGIFALCVSLLHLPTNVEQISAAVGAGVWVAWSFGYFAVFWSTAGQTPGDRIMEIHVLDARDPARPIPLRRALLRFVVLVLGAIPLFAGYLPVLLDRRRRALHDMVARTVVEYGGRGA